MRALVSPRGQAAFLTTLLAFTAVSAYAQSDQAATARQSAQAVGPSIVTVSVVLKVTDEDGTEETKTESIGTVIDPSGLTVVSLASIDPTEIIGQLMGSDAPFQAAVSDVKIRLADGQEIPAKVVLRDKDQDLAFLRPAKKPETPMSAVDLKNNVQRDLMDSVLLVGRLGRVANRTLSARLETIEGVLERPRRRYMLGGRNPAADVGSLALTPDGKVVGLVGLRVIRTTGDDVSVIGMLLGGGPTAVVATTIIPASDIAPIAAQAPADAPKTAEAAPRPAPKPAPAVAPKPAPKPAPKAPAKAPAPK